MLGVLSPCHLNEAESAHLAGVAVFDNRDRLNSSINPEYRSELLFRYGRIQVADKNVNHCLPFSRRQTKGSAVFAAFPQAVPRVGARLTLAIPLVLW